MSGNIMNIICDECHQKFISKQIKIEEEWLDDNKTIVRQYYLCPICKHKYVIAVMDEEVRKLIEQYRAYCKKQRVLNKKSVVASKLNEKKIKELKKEIKLKSDKLVEEWENKI